jgi:hypothetical protein
MAKETDKNTNKYLHNTAHKTKYWAPGTPQKTRLNSGGGSWMSNLWLQQTKHCFNI